MSKLSSGGRGEYEIAERIGSLTPSNLLDRPIKFLVGDLGMRESCIAAIRDKDQGKNRLRRLPGGKIHLVRQIAAAALLPKPIRDEAKLPGGQPTVMEGRFICRRAYFKAARLTEDGVDVEIGTLNLDNGSQVEDVDFSSRMRRVRKIHADRQKLIPAISSALGDHEAAISGPEQIASPGERAVKAIMKAVAEAASDYNIDYTEGADVLETLEEILQLPNYEKPVSVEEIPPAEYELRQREISKWRRWAAYRGSESAKFRRAVREAYDSRCIVSGIRLPKSEFCRVPGVDSAHILPWAQYDLDHVCNGLCLSKHYHWAFDQGLIAIRYNNQNRTYFIEVTDLAEQAFADEEMALNELRTIEGSIPRDRLPQNAEDWPRPEFLERLYEKMNEG